MNAPYAAIRKMFLSAATLLVIASPALAASLEPTGLQDGQLLQKNQAELRIGFSYADDMRNLFQSEDRDRRVMEVPSLTLNLGLAERVEAQLQYSYLHLSENGQGDKWGSGDVTLGLKVRLWQESLRLPAIALRLATKLPNADNEDDFGTDEADIFIDALFTRNYPLFTLYVNAGMAILGDPRSGNDGQDDVWRYGVGVRIPVLQDTMDALISIEGTEGDDSVNNRGALRAGVQTQVGPFTWDLGGSVGYVSKSEDWSLRTGLTVPFELPSDW